MTIERRRRRALIESCGFKAAAVSELRRIAQCLPYRLRQHCGPLPTGNPTNPTSDSAMFQLAGWL